ncbi:hypothetical protein FO488_16065 [Geobacter sp. FeAm09]|uniref:hypothetical protein n=1 Tax=Geobacter sp. FeAm09 TaxID=2597769 RepID=UPI0011EFF14D|nr:hypothetical protein [Geobacter sp. FeAm09]QEM69522.1 hypothetical protein FO488_16065 [Geobacter sp. FeAm09]
MTVFEKLDEIMAKVDLHKIEPLFSIEVSALNSRYETTITREGNNLLRVMAKLIAYSNNAPSDKITQLLETDYFELAFHRFDLAAVASDTPERIVKSHWPTIKAIRFQKKVGYIVECARLLLEHGKDKATIESLYQQYNIPTKLANSEDIDSFWQKFDTLLIRYERERMPYFKNMTTLLHLLLHVGFPCVKPDLVVMRTAAQIGLVQGRDNHNAYRPAERKLVVKTIQEYCLSRSVHPAIIDLYLLVHGRQLDSIKYVSQDFIPVAV